MISGKEVGRMKLGLRQGSSAKILSIILVGAVALAGCSAGSEADNADQTKAKVEIKTVKVAEIEKISISEPDEQVADVVASSQVDIALKAPGDVERLLKQRGDFVKKGEVIFQLDQTDMKLQQQKAQLGVQSAKVQLDNGTLELQKSIKKVERAVRDAMKAGNTDQIEDMQMDLESLQQQLASSPLKIQYKSAQIGLEELNRTLENMNVKAPISGVLTDLPVQVGMTLPAGFRAGQIQTLSPVKIVASLTENAMNKVDGKKELKFYASGDSEQRTAKINYLSDVMDAQSKSFKLELQVDNADKRLKPGMKVQVVLTEAAEQLVVSVPTLSIVREGGDNFVFVLNQDHVEKRKVELGRIKDIHQEVLEGVKEGELLVISGQNQLKDQEEVKVQK